MEDFVIHSSILGSEKHFFEGEWITEIPDDVWVVGGNYPERDLLTALYFSGRDISINPPEVYRKVMNNFTYRNNLPWQMIMPEDVFDNFVQESYSKISRAFNISDLSYFENVYVKSLKTLDSLQPIRIHKKKLNYLMEREIPGVNPYVIESFTPDENGFAKKIEYSLKGTITGRMKVSSGPEILLLNKELKGIIKSRYKGGKVVQFDYVSLEPRLALEMAGHEASEDIYFDINKMAFGGQFSRDIVKVATLSVMFGAGSQKLSGETGLPVSVCQKIIKDLKEFFGVHEHSKRLVKEYKSKKRIKNLFGRSIFPESGAAHKLYNHYIQSSAVDLAMLGFGKVIKVIEGMGIIPIFIIHDNLGLDFPPEMIKDEVFEMIKESVGEVDGFSGKLLLDRDII